MEQDLLIKFKQSIPANEKEEVVNINEFHTVDNRQIKIKEFEYNSRTQSPNEWPHALRMKEYMPNKVQNYGNF